jgi:hypothetical protein
MIARGLAHRAAIDDAIDGSQPSSTGLAAVAAAVTSVRGRQAARVELHAEGMLAAAYQYDAADAQSASDLTPSV